MFFDSSPNAVLPCKIVGIQCVVENDKLHLLLIAFRFLLYFTTLLLKIVSRTSLNCFFFLGIRVIQEHGSHKTDIRRRRTNVNLKGTIIVTYNWMRWQTTWSWFIISNECEYVTDIYKIYQNQTHRSIDLISCFIFKLNLWQLLNSRWTSDSAFEVWLIK